MKGTDTVVATCMIAGAIVAFLVWFLWDLSWQALGIGLFVGLSLYAWMARPKPKGKPEKEQETIGFPGF